ncbi:MAG: DUF423 domain-containing protein [Thiothrix sp.]|jgi:uncharacterized membrane protein YgdD (TMEM256/DUF423 family)|uniref:DUF423 domain-containing protein n=1 Tax=Thiothrix sp. TaxID=1032 RepID=UPI00262CA48D|nr:DUF423 domain-containing protein [Thiothrix sp.]MDD5393972.1 DUF423 domain-containing protein [Thiothrix sp.]
MQKSVFLSIGAVLGMLAVMLGAFGAHGLERLVDAPMLQRFHTGVEYQFYHALALLLVGLLQMQFSHRFLNYAGFAFIIGVLLFSGSLYLYVLTGISKIAIITPFGGTAFIAGWLLLALGVQRSE